MAGDSSRFACAAGAPPTARCRRRCRAGAPSRPRSRRACASPSAATGVASCDRPAVRCSGAVHTGSPVAWSSARTPSRAWTTTSRPASTGAGPARVRELARPDERPVGERARDESVGLLARQRSIVNTRPSAMLGELCGEVTTLHRRSLVAGSNADSCVPESAPCCAACTSRPPSSARPPTSGAFESGRARCSRASRAACRRGRTRSRRGRSRRGTSCSRRTGARRRSGSRPTRRAPPAPAPRGGVDDVHAVVHEVHPVRPRGWARPRARCPPTRSSTPTRVARRRDARPPRTARPRRRRTRRRRRRRRASRRSSSRSQSAARTSTRCAAVRRGSHRSPRSARCRGRTSSSLGPAAGAAQAARDCRRRRARAPAIR